MSTLFIKNMVCNRCIMVVQNELDKLGLTVKKIKLGEVTLDKEITPEEKNNLDIKLIDLKPLKDLRVINASLKDIEKMKYSEDYIKIVLTDTDIQINQ